MQSDFERATCLEVVRQTRNVPRRRSSSANAGVLVIAADEAGRGPLAGPVVAAAIARWLPRDKSLPLGWIGLNDSKAMTESQRERTARDIDQALASGCRASLIAKNVHFVEAPVIDELNILQASLEAMAVCIHGCLVSSRELYGPAVVTPGNVVILVDGPYLPHCLRIPGSRGGKPPKRGLLAPADVTELSRYAACARAIVKGDARCPSVALASVAAKVARDAHMTDVLDSKHPSYGFAKHKGYPVPSHVEVLSRLGPITGVHRRTYGPVKRAEGLWKKRNAALHRGKLAKKASTTAPRKKKSSLYTPVVRKR